MVVVDPFAIFLRVFCFALHSASIRTEIRYNILTIGKMLNCGTRILYKIDIFNNFKIKRLGKLSLENISSSTPIMLKKNYTLDFDPIRI